jgi:hypothetical protein
LPACVIFRLQNLPALIIFVATPPPEKACGDTKDIDDMVSRRAIQRN